MAHSKKGEIFKPPTASTSTTLSKSVMGMKFMKRKEEAKVNEEKAIEKYNKINDNNWITNSDTTIMEFDNGNNVAEPLTCTRDDVDLYASLPGRRSFGGFNKAVENHYQQMINRERFQIKTNTKNEVTDEEMFQRYETLVGLPRGPNQGKRQEHKHFVSSSEPNVHAIYNKKANDFRDDAGNSGDISISMEDIKHFEDRKGDAKRKHCGNNQNNHQQKKKFKR